MIGDRRAGAHLNPTAPPYGRPVFKSELPRIPSCVIRDEGIAVEQLRRISFFQNQVNLETDDRQGGTDVFTWPIRPSSLDS
jgi:hypothetical protein